MIIYLIILNVGFLGIVFFFNVEQQHGFSLLESDEHNLYLLNQLYPKNIIIFTIKI